MLLPLQSDGESGRWQVPNRSSVYQRCENLDSPSACNWLVSAADYEAGQRLCISCRLNRTIPDLSVPANCEYWLRIEQAKRRLVSSLVALGLPVSSRVSEDPEHGLAFDFLRPSLGDKPILTGHADGIITLNIEEADDSNRERVREQLHEPYRTLLGHLRHETGHYYWSRLIEHSEKLNAFREVFGDEKQDYNAALQNHYSRGPSPDWPEHFVSAYASSHPWEDWAETWAHYLHSVDLLDTALSFRLNIGAVELPFEEFRPESLAHPAEPNAATFLHLLNSWARFTAVLNELSRSMGLPDFYPFVLSSEAVAKLHFVHTIVTPHKGS